LGRKGNGYGSEWHFDHYRRVLPAALDQQIRRNIGRTDARIEWVYPDAGAFEKEPRGLEFLKSDPSQRETLEAWRAFWPQTGSPPNWDGVARDATSGEWLLFETKANHPEFCSHVCGAVGKGRTLIESTMSKVKRHLSVHRDFQWLGTYYQYANRLACLYFLNVLRTVPARLVLVYFIGDKFPDARQCPSSEAEWRELIRACHLTLGLSEKHALRNRVHELFIPVAAE
jgi:hypothetical protein